MSIVLRNNGSSAEINVTPLIDVLLVLLIIFMVLLPHRYKGEMADIPQPATDGAMPHPEGAIVVQLHDEGDGQRPALKINGETVSWDGLGPRLQKLFLSRADRSAFVKADPEIEFQYPAQAVDITHEAGADRIGLMGAKD
jgi:biopolymer transport protein TolR